MHRVIRVTAQWDDEACVWTASSDDIGGLSVEAADFDTLRKKVLAAVLDLIEMNGDDDDGAQDIPVHICADRLETIRRYA